ncbi:MAG: hypothetical protein N2450_00300 [bacterium]|nr:hypothetical protein [bacterium]
MLRFTAIIICGIAGLIILVEFFFRIPLFTKLQNGMMDWVIILLSFSYLMGGISIFLSHLQRIQRKYDGWYYSLVLVVCLLLMVTLGIFVDYGPNGAFQWLFKNVQNPMQSTMFALLAFYVSSASYRAFRVRNLHATLLFVAAVLVMIGKVPIGEILWSKFPEISQWILSVPSLAAQRALTIGAALGLIATGLKTLLGIERSWLGK